MDYKNYEKEVNEIRKQNQVYIDQFESSLIEKGLNAKTIKRHVSNIDFYINEYLCFYTPQGMENGCFAIDDFLGSWGRDKCICLSKDSIDKYCSSIRKFYKVMLDLKYIEDKDYAQLLYTIKNEKETWIELLEDFFEE